MRTGKLLLFLFLAQMSWAQNLTQVIRGKVMDAASRWPLPGAAVVVTGTKPVIGTTTDTDGTFRLEGVPVGRVDLEITFIGYTPQYQRNLELTTGKELVLEIYLQESIQQLEEVTVTAERNNLRPQNEMAMVSARSFSVEESQRFAGARNDVARMAQNFAGVRSGNDAVNDIVIRGNAPSGLLWRLEGVDIPNPNHYGQYGGTGGPVSMLNNNMLRNSDFLTAAFPSEYGNALAGVFDLSMRNGNNGKHEFLGQVGFNGLEAGAEGPLGSKGASYLISYRYSVLGILQAMGVDFGTGTALPEYQDLSFKLHFPGRKYGSFSIFGLGGKSQIDFVNSAQEPDAEQGLYAQAERDVYSRGAMGVVGATHTYAYSNNTFHQITLSASAMRNGDYVDTLDANRSPHAFYGQDFVNARYAAAYRIQSKLNARNQFKAGVIYNALTFDLLDTVYESGLGRFIPVTKQSGSTSLVQAFGQWQHRATERLTLQAGLYSQHLVLNGITSLEPRVSAKYLLTDNQALTAGYGLHSQMAPVQFYFLEATDDLGNGYYHNTNLGFVYSNHFVLGHEWMLNESLQLKTEVYYQRLFDVITEAGSSSYSIVNLGTFNGSVPDSLENTGTGTNYGVEFTLQQSLNNGLYYLVTASVYRSLYAGSDGIERPTAYDSGLLLNATGGKEFLLNKSISAKRRHSLTVDTKVTYNGGQKTAPIDVDRSFAEGETVRNWDEANTVQYPGYFRWDLRIAYRMQGKRVTQEWAMDIQNVTNRKNPYFDQLNLQTGEVEYVNQIGILPVAQYRITF